MGKNLPKVSVIIPCYNCEKWIERCLSSIVAQDYSGETEVICVDDCSSDNTVNIIEGYKKKTGFDIRLLKNFTNEGPGESRNTGIRESTGEWLAFCDSDDWYDNNYISRMIEQALKENSDLIICEYRKVFESGKKTVDVKYLDNIVDDKNKEEIIAKIKSSLWLIMMKKYLFDNVRIPELRNGEDVAIVPCIVNAAENISILRTPLYNYYFRSNSISNAVSPEIYLSMTKAFDFMVRNFGSDYRDALEFLGIKTIMYGATLNAYKADISDDEIKEIADKFEKQYPEWTKNRYIESLGMSKKLYLKLIHNRRMLMCKLVSKLHKIFSV